LIVGILLVAFVIVAPSGIVGLVRKFVPYKPAALVGRGVKKDASGAAP
jgi:hypothetical protein